MKSFRNMLVHHYESVEDEVVFGIFRGFIFEYLKKVKKD